MGASSLRTQSRRSPRSTVRNDATGTGGTAMSPETCGAGAPAREKTEAKAHSRKVNALRARIIRPLSLLVAILREIFDEGAYQRYLTRSAVASSATAYHDFLRE